MKPTILTIPLAALLSLVAPAPGDDWKDESGRGRGQGGPPPWAGRGDDDRKEYWKRVEERRREDAKRFEERQREGRKRYEERWREGQKRAEERARGDAERYREDGRDYSREPWRGRGYGPDWDRVRPTSYPLDGPRGYGRGPGYAPGPWYDAASPTLYPSDVHPRGDGYPAIPYREERYPITGDPGVYPGPVIPYADEPYPLRADYEVNPTQYTAPAPVDQVPALAHQLARQAEAFLQAFNAKAGVVPEWGRFMADATALRDAAVRFRDVTAQGADYATMRAEFQGVAASWQRFEGRIARVSRGNVGPNIATALEMGRTVDQIAQLLP